MADRTLIEERGQMPRFHRLLKSLLWGAMLLAVSVSFPTQAAKFELMEATINDITAAYENRSLTARKSGQDVPGSHRGL